MAIVLESDSDADLKLELSMHVQSISSEEIRLFTAALLDRVSVVVWKRRASRVHHPVDERGPWGNLLHTLRVVRLVKLISDCCDFGPSINDVLISAALLHDICRFGLDDSAASTVPEHPFLVRKLAESIQLPECKYSDLIFSFVESHMGKWGEPPMHSLISPYTALHLADAISAHAEEVWKIEE